MVSSGGAWLDRLINRPLLMAAECAGAPAEELAFSCRSAPYYDVIHEPSDERPLERCHDRAPRQAREANAPSPRTLAQRYVEEG
jgi:hypothetical protein